MMPEPDQDVAVTEVRTLHVFDAQQNTWRELGRVPNQVTVKPGTRVADGKFTVRSGVAEGQYRVGFEVVKASVNDTKQLPLTVTRNQASLAAPAARVAAVGTPDAAAVSESAPAAAPRTAPPSALGEAQPRAPSTAADTAPLSSLGEAHPKGPSAPGTAPLSTLGEQHPRPPTTGLTTAQAKAGGVGAAYFRVSKVTGRATLRGGPGAGHTVVGTVGQGDTFPIVEKVTNPRNELWYRIRLDSGTEAWVMGALGDEVAE
jgi:hypothetical protein